MYQFSKGNYVYTGYGDGCYSPVREIKRISEEEYKFWDNIEKQIRDIERQNKYKSY